MLEPITPADESERLQELRDLCLLDTPNEERFDRLTRIAKQLFGVGTALVSLIDADRLWFKSRQGMALTQVPRNVSFCGHAILESGAFVVEDTAADTRFADNSLVTALPGIGFYAGIPLFGPNGHAIGTLCLLDPKSRSFSAHDVSLLADLAVLVTQEMSNRELGDAVSAAKESEALLREITNTVPALIGYRDRSQRFLFHNQAYEEIFNLPHDQIHGQTITELAGAAMYAAVQPKIDEVLLGYPVRYEQNFTNSKQQVRIYDMQYYPRYGEGLEANEVIGFYSLGTDITELKRINRMKTEFISTVSHELRTPLTSIRGSLGLVLGGVAGDLSEAVKSLIGIANNNCERLIRLINDILDSEKIESGKMALQIKVVDMVRLAHQTVAANEGFAGQHGIGLRLELAGASDTLLQLSIDSDRMQQVITNLISNAVKFSPAGGVVTLRLARQAGRVRLEVIDRGQGIPEDFHDRIFQKFSQADSSDTRLKGGTGLGLNISRALVERMGGDIGFTTKAGEGTTFFCEFPEFCDQPALPAAMPAAPADGLIQQTSQRTPQRILVCETDRDVARLIGLMLAKAGFAPEMVHSPAEALERIARGGFVALTVDLNPSSRGGAAFINAVRSDERTRNLPVVVISALAEQGRLQFIHKLLTVSDWLEKPIDENRLIQSVRRAVAGPKTGKSRILHVEDDPDIRSIVSAIVQDSADFEFAETLADARRCLQASKFDLILLDLALGDESGWSLFPAIDQLEPRPPVIVFSASDAAPAGDEKVEAVLVKSSTTNTELLNAIQRALQIPPYSGDPVTSNRIS